MPSKKPGIPGFFASRLSVGNFPIDQAADMSGQESCRGCAIQTACRSRDSPHMQATVWLIANQQCGSGRMKNKKAPDSGAFPFRRPLAPEAVICTESPDLKASRFPFGSLLIAPLATPTGQAVDGTYPYAHTGKKARPRERFPT